MKERDVYSRRLSAWKKNAKKGAKNVKKVTKRTPYRQDKGSRDRWSGALKIPKI